MALERFWNYKDTVEETKEMLDHPQTEAALREAADRGVDIEVILHLNTSETIR